MTTEDDWEEWFCNYTEFILHYARLAEECDIEILCIGTELFHPATRYPRHWREIIAQIRSVYSGQLTYAANFHEEYERIEWWDALDYIGIQAYFPLSEQERPNLSSLQRGWKKHGEALERFARKEGKLVLLTELGYRNDELSAREPWLWPGQIDRQQVEVDDALQAKCFEAFFTTCWNEEWLAGAFIWKWFPATWKFTSYEDYRAARQMRLDSLVALGEIPEHRAQRDIYFTPQSRPAESVIRKYYGKELNLRK